MIYFLAEQHGKSRTSTTKHNYSTNPEKVNSNFSRAADETFSVTDDVDEDTAEEAGVRFSMKLPVEETDELIAWHNISSSKIDEAIELGGLAMPSFAAAFPHYCSLA